MRSLFKRNALLIFNEVLEQSSFNVVLEQSSFGAKLFSFFDMFTYRKNDEKNRQTFGRRENNAYICSRKQYNHYDMTTVVIDSDTRYAIPDYDIDFFIAIANKMGWKKIKSSLAKKESWVDQFAGAWQDTRSTDEIIADIHDARTTNAEVSL